MTIAPGDRLPEATFKYKTSQGVRDVSMRELVKGKKAVIIGMPGAFTPTCHMNHLPGFIEHQESIRARGVDEIIVVSVNDHHVMHEWARSVHGEGKIRFLGDMSAEFTNAVGMDQDMSAAGLGLRSKRYSMIVEDGIVQTVNLEKERGKVQLTGAAHLLGQL